MSVREPSRREGRCWVREGSSPEATANPKSPGGLEKIMSECPTPEKRRYGKPDSARALKHKKQWEPTNLLRPYLCKCGYWHMTNGPTHSDKV